MGLRGRSVRCTTASGTDEEKWEQIYGSTLYGNLPQHKKHHHVGHCWAPCPYSTQCSDLRREHMIGTYGGTVNDHTANGKVHYMATSNRGVWGYECTFDNCPYYTVNGRRYFYA